KWCYECGLLPKHEAFNKRNREYQELLAQIDCAIILNLKGELNSLVRSKYSQVSNFNKWINYSFKELDTLIKNQANRPKKYRSDNLDKLLKYYKKEIYDSKYQQLVEIYPALGGLLEAVEEYGIEDWMAKCIQYMVNKTMDEKRPIFIGMAQSVTKVLDKMERNVTTMRGIQYNETFVDFLIVLISISTLAIRWITLNLAGPTIRFLRQIRNKSNNSFDLLGINVSNFSKLINNWRCAYNYSGPVICAKDQTKIAEMIEVDRRRARFVGCVQMQQTSIPYSMSIDELQQKLKTLKKATYITVFAISAVIPGIPPLVIAVLPSDQKETLANIIEENNLVVKHLNCANAKLVGLYFDGAPHDRNWLGRTYFTNYEFQNKLGLVK
ncbi:8953_t:CDS:1, partial [Gigaspora margarita]